LANLQIFPLHSFEDAFWSSYSELEPCILLTYLFKLSDKVSKALKELKVQSEPDIQLATTRYLLFDLSRNVLGAGLHIIGLQPLEEM
jgi:arginyl-tRNA synthetase